MDSSGPMPGTGGVEIPPYAERDTLLQAALDSVSQGIAVFDADLRILAQNRLFMNMIGSARRTDVDQSNLTECLTLLPGLTPAGDRQLQALIREAAAKGGTSMGNAIHLEMGHGPPLCIKLVLVAEGRWSLQLESAPANVTSDPDLTSLDPLTGLPNRSLLGRRLVQACSELTDVGKPSAVLAVDLDRFKNVNDTLGHPIGDLLLQTVAQRLQSVVRADDLVSRVGGDEFIIVLVDQGEKEAAAAATRIVELMKRPFLLRGHLVNIGASVGIALAPQDASDADALLSQADLALYQAKANGRGTFSFFRPELQEHAQARRTLEQELRKALMLRQYELYYQPQIDVDTGKLSGFEALLRWKHPTRGLINPAAFVPLLEELGLILPVGEWMLRTACVEAMRWPVELSVAVNIAAAHFEGDRLTATVAAALAASGLPAHRLEIEVTETALLHNGDATRAALHILQDMGVNVAMDEFGTGYSSMSQLRSFPFDRIKIDRSFVDGASINGNDAAIVRAIAGLGVILGMRTTAEGVETAEQLEQIRAHGCTEVQGYLLGRPVPETELGAVITALSSTTGVSAAVDRSTHSIGSQAA